MHRESQQHKKVNKTLKYNMTVKNETVAETKNFCFKCNSKLPRKNATNKCSILGVN